MGRRKKIENVIKELVVFGEDEIHLNSLLSEGREDTIRSDSKEFK